MAEQMIEVKFDEQRLAQIRAMLRAIPNAMPKVMSRGINRTATSAKAEIARKVAAKAKVRQKGVKKRIYLKKATYNTWRATVNISGRPIPLIWLGARETKKGVTSKAKGQLYIKELGVRGTPFEEIKGASSFIPSAFKQKLPKTGYTGIWRRVSLTDPRWPIGQIYGPSIGELYKGITQLTAGIQQSTAKKLQKNIDAQVKYILEKRRAG